VPPDAESLVPFGVAIALVDVADVIPDPQQEWVAALARRPEDFVIRDARRALDVFVVLALVRPEEQLAAPHFLQRLRTELPHRQRGNADQPARPAALIGQAFFRLVASR
jgi:hypothetical protein